MSLPSEPITFLFTDIEGSTRLWEQHPEAMRSALACHDALLREVIEGNNGQVFKTIGDAFCAVFADAFDALQAACQAQLLLLDQDWGALGSLRVRMALHTGYADQRDGDYFGPTLNRIARLLATGYGQQTLLSQSTHTLVCNSLPGEVTLLDLGRHRLKDLLEPEYVWQLCHLDLPTQFPALKSLEGLPNNLPRQLTSFIGREEAMGTVQALLKKTSLLTLTGSGGCGKTRLALQAAAESLENYPDGVWLIELASLSDPTLAAQTIADVLGLREEAGKSITQTLLDFLKERNLLLLLDNCEHLLDACARLADTLLRHCSHVKILASSREGLGIAGEQTFRVPSLTSPDPKRTITPDALAEFEAVQLFIERAQAVQPTFGVTSSNATALAQLCARLDGIPLAIELAAARVRSLSAEEINLRLDNRFRLLTGGNRTALPRQQTLRALIDWSYDLLNPQEKVLFQRLAVFAGGWTLEAAEVVCADTDIQEKQATHTNPQHLNPPTLEYPQIENWEVLDLLTSLVDKSLVFTDQNDGRTRYRMLETIRQYARDRLLESGESDMVRCRHRQFFLDMAEQSVPKLTSPEQAQWLQALENEHENLRLSLDWSLSEVGSTACLQFCAALARFWGTRGYISEGREWCEQALAATADQEKGQLRAKTSNGAAVMASFQGDYISARRYHEDSLAIRREIDDRNGIAVSLGNLGNVAYYQGELDSARSYYEQSLAIYKEIEDRHGVSASLHNLGNVARAQGDYPSSLIYQEQSLAIDREIGDQWGIAMSLSNLGNVAYVNGNYTAAKEYYEESLTIHRELGDRHGIASSMTNLGSLAVAELDYAPAQKYYEESLAIRKEIGDRSGIALALTFLGILACQQGDYTAADAYCREGLNIRKEIGDRNGIAYSLEAVAGLNAKIGQWERVIVLSAAAEALREEIGAPLPPNEREENEHVVESARSMLDEELFARAWNSGRTLSLDQAIEFALEKPE